MERECILKTHIYNSYNNKASCMLLLGVEVKKIKITKIRKNLAATCYVLENSNWPSYLQVVTSCWRCEEKSTLNECIEIAQTSIC